VPAGAIADRIGKAQVTIIAMAISGSAAIATRAQLRRADLAHPAVDHRLGNFRHFRTPAQFSALVAECVSAGHGRQPDDPANGARLRADRG
jgi:hypothetical protein